MPIPLLCHSFQIKIKFVDLINLSFYRYSIFNIFLIAIKDKISSSHDLFVKDY